MILFILESGRQYLPEILNAKFILKMSEVDTTTMHHNNHVGSRATLNQHITL